MPEDADRTALFVRAGAHLCALPVRHVVETMRPVPVTALAGVPHFITGLALVRGEPLPVIDLATFMDPRSSRHVSRFVTVRAAGRQAVLAVDAVLGVADIDSKFDTPSLVADACQQSIEWLSARDGELLALLSTARIVPPELGKTLDTSSACP